IASLDSGQLVAGSNGDDEITLNRRRGLRYYEATIGGAGEGRNDASNSPASRTLTLTGVTSKPSDCAAFWIAPNTASPAGLSELRMTATRVTLGAICLRSSTHFALKLYS